MTAEIAIANAGAVALAADSAVTIPGPAGQKTYHCALKLFALSKVEPVGIMVYGNAGLMHVPWEPLIKGYRKELGAQALPELEDYAAGFIGYLGGHPSAFPGQAQRDWAAGNARGYFRMMRRELDEKLSSMLEGSEGTQDAFVAEQLGRVVSMHHRDLSGRDFIEGFGESDLKMVMDNYESAFRDILRNVFEGIGMSAETEEMLCAIAACLCVKRIFRNDASGMVVAGYGESDLYPKIATYRMDGCIAGKLKCMKNRDKSFAVRDGLDCHIAPFAQEDMVATFMSGIDPAVRNWIEGYWNGRFGEMAKFLGASSIGDVEKERVSAKLQSMLEEFLHGISSVSSKKHTHPVLRMVSALPKDELAAMAEALVNLTAFKRRITESMETVGGPVDVMVISKGDGLVWARRKHYFPPELNHPFFENYFRGINHG